MDSTSSIYVFGDQTNAFEANLTQILHIKNNSVLTTFLEQTHYALRVEISRLPILQKGLFPRFTSIIDLLARNSDSGSNPALESALICLTQLACFIRYVCLSPFVPKSADQIYTDIMDMGQDHIQMAQTALSLVCVLDL